MSSPPGPLYHCAAEAGSAVAAAALPLTVVAAAAAGQLEGEPH